jgi:hypothetical protein
MLCFVLPVCCPPPAAGLAAGVFSNNIDEVNTLSRGIKSGEQQQQQQQQANVFDHSVALSSRQHYRPKALAVTLQLQLLPILVSAGICRRHFSPLPVLSCSLCSPGYYC